MEIMGHAFLKRANKLLRLNNLGHQLRCLQKPRSQKALSLGRYFIFKNLLSFMEIPKLLKTLRIYGE